MQNKQFEVGQEILVYYLLLHCKGACTQTMRTIHCIREIFLRYQNVAVYMRTLSTPRCINEQQTTPRLKLYY